jgi:hypothetical protein
MVLVLVITQRPKMLGLEKFYVLVQSLLECRQFLSVCNKLRRCRRMILPSLEAVRISMTIRKLLQCQLQLLLEIIARRPQLISMVDGRLGRLSFRGTTEASALPSRSLMHTFERLTVIDPRADDLQNLVVLDLEVLLDDFIPDVALVHDTDGLVALAA